MTNFQLIIYPPKSPIIGTFFDYPIRYYGLIMAFTFVLGISLGYFLIKRKISKQDSELFLDYSPLVIFFSVIGARLFYIFGDLNYYLKNPLEIIMINHGGISIFGAIFMGLLSLYLLSKNKKFDFLKHLDIIAVVFPLCQAIGRFGNYFNQEAYGAPTNGFLKLYVDKYHRYENFINYDFFHPTFLYESILDLFLFFILLNVLFIKNNFKKGTIACIYLISYSTIRLFIEQIRVDSVLNIGNIPIVQLICILVLILSILTLIYFNKKCAK